MKGRGQMRRGRALRGGDEGLDAVVLRTYRRVGHGRVQWTAGASATQVYSRLQQPLPMGILESSRGSSPRPLIERLLQYCTRVGASAGYRP